MAKKKDKPSHSLGSKNAPAMCSFCEEHENKGTVVMLFPSEEDFKQSPYYDGEDNVKDDPIAEKAVWIGKNNHGRSFEDYWICCPVHPNCSHSFETYTPRQEEDFDSDFGIDLLAEQAELNRQYEEEKERSKDERLSKSELGYRKLGQWKEKDCSCQESEYENIIWLKSYLGKYGK